MFRAGLIMYLPIRLRPRILQRNVTMMEVADIPSHKSQSMAACGNRDKAINHRQSVTGSFCPGLECGPLAHLLLPERKHAPGKGGKEFGHQPALQFPSLPSLGEQNNALSDFRNRDHADIKREAGLGGEPTRDIWVWAHLGRLAQDIRIEKKIQNDTLRGRSLLRAIESSLKSAGQFLKTSQIPPAGAWPACQSAALIMTTKGFPCFVTSWGSPCAAFSATVENRCLAV